MASVSGLGAVSSLGRGTAQLWAAIEEGRDGLALIRRFDPGATSARIAGMVPDRNHPGEPETGPRLCLEFALVAAREAWADAGLDRVASHRVALVFGSSLGDARGRLHWITEQLGDALGVGGPRLTVSTACASSTNAIGLALDLLDLGVADAVVAGGADVLTPLVLAGFNTLGVLSAGKCAPFSEPTGTSLGEGAGFVVLERDAARRRSPLAILGYGLSADGYHDTGPDPTGAGVARAIRGALAHARVSPDDVDYVNAHGTGTRANDPAEWRAFQLVFRGRAAAIPISSSKSFLGHAQGAAGVLETIATLLAMEHGTIPPTQRFSTPRPNSPPDPVAQATPRAARCEIAVCTNSAFGGANCALVVGRADTARATVRRPISIVGCGTIGPRGIDARDLLGAPSRGRAAPIRFEALVPSADPRGLDPCTRYVTAAVALALADAGVRLGGEARDRSGLVLGVCATSAESDAALQETIDHHGYRGLSASLFARQVLNAPAGTCARLLGLHGPTSTVSGGRATGLLAFVYAAELLATRGDLDRIVAVGVDELSAGEPGAEASEGASSAVLSATTGAVRVAGWSVAGPGRLPDAAAAALGAAHLDRIDLVFGPLPPGVEPRTVIDPARLFGDSEAFTAASAVVAAAMLIRAGEARHVLITQAGGRSADCALALVAGDQDGR